MSNRRKPRPGPRVLVDQKTYEQAGKRGPDGIRQSHAQVATYRTALLHGNRSGTINSTVEAIRSVTR